MGRFLEFLEPAYLQTFRGARSSAFAARRHEGSRDSQKAGFDDTSEVSSGYVEVKKLQQDSITCSPSSST